MLGLTFVSSRAMLITVQASTQFTLVAPYLQCTPPAWRSLDPPGLVWCCRRAACQWAAVPCIDVQPVGCGRHGQCFSRQSSDMSFWEAFCTLLLRSSCGPAAAARSGDQLTNTFIITFLLSFLNLPPLSLLCIITSQITPLPEPLISESTDNGNPG